MRLNWFSRAKAAKRDLVPQFTVYERKALEQPGLPAGPLSRAGPAGSRLPTSAPGSSRAHTR